jgi:hypothetical protein
MRRSTQRGPVDFTEVLGVSMLCSVSKDSRFILLRERETGRSYNALTPGHITMEAA